MKALAVPPPPPPDRLGISMVVINLKTGKPETFKPGDTWENRAPWIYTFTEVYYRMEPDGTGYKPVRDHTRVVVVDIQKHVIKSIEIE